MLEIWKLSHVVNLLLLRSNLPLQDVWLQSLIEVGHADACIDDRQNDQNNSQNSKTGEVLADRQIVGCLGRLIHAGELENEVRQATEEKKNCRKHSGLILSSSPESCHEKYDDRYGNRSDGNPFLSVSNIADYNHELYSETEEEEEIELQQSNENLQMLACYLNELSWIEL